MNQREAEATANPEPGHGKSPQKSLRDIFGDARERLVLTLMTHIGPYRRWKVNRSRESAYKAVEEWFYGRSKIKREEESK